MNIIIRRFVLLFILIVLISLLSCGCSANKESSLINDRQYYSYFLNNKEDVVYSSYSHVVQEENILDINNLELYLYANRVYTFQSDENNVETIRLNLLESGQAKIIDKEKATEAEIESQNKAKEEHRGIWGFSLNAIWEWIVQNQIFFSILFPSGLLFIIIKYIIKCHRLRKIYIQVGGESYVGKTTLIHALEFKDATESDLLSQTPTWTPIKTFLNFFSNKIEIDCIILDPPGDDHYNIIDNLTKYSKKVMRKYIIIIIFAPTKYNTLDKLHPADGFDVAYILQQLFAIEMIWSAVLKSSIMIRPAHLIAYINKSDLFDAKGKKELLKHFEPHKEKLKEYCLEKKIKFTCLSGSISKRENLTKITKIMVKP